MLHSSCAQFTLRTELRLDGRWGWTVKSRTGEVVAAGDCVNEQGARQAAKRGLGKARKRAGSLEVQPDLPAIAGVPS